MSHLHFSNLSYKYRTVYLQDIITDLVVERAPVKVKGVKNAYVHTGMLQSAKYVQQKLLEEQILEKAFGSYEVCLDANDH